MSARRIAALGLMTSLALVLSALERLVPIPLPLPFVKLGLANAVTLYALYRMGAREAALVVVCRCLLMFLLFGNAAALALSLTGGLVSLPFMALASSRRLREWFSPLGVSVAGAATHNAGQVLAAALIVGSGGISAYLLVLLPLSVVSGALVSFVYSAVNRAGAREKVVEHD